jgi:hypothetical protein
MVNYGDHSTTASEPEKRYVLDITPFWKRLLVKRSLQDLGKFHLQYVESLNLHHLEPLKQAS